MTSSSQNSVRDHENLVFENTGMSNNVSIGKKNTGSSIEIQKAIDEARKEEVRIDSNFIDLKNGKEVLLFQIANFRVREKQAVKDGLKEETRVIRNEILRAQETIDKINGILKTDTAEEDHKRIQSIIHEWYGEKRELGKERAKLETAENSLKSAPWDRHLQGESNRARAEITETKKRLEEIAREAKLTEEKLVVSPVRDESIASYTHEQAVADRKTWEDHHKKLKEQIGIDILQKEREPQTQQETHLAIVHNELPALHTPYYKAVERIKKEKGSKNSNNKMIEREKSSHPTIAPPTIEVEKTSSPARHIETSIPLLAPDELIERVKKNRSTKEHSLRKLAEIDDEITTRGKKNDDISVEKQSYLLNAVRDGFASIPDVEISKPSQKLNFSRIFNDFEFMSRLFSKTEKSLIMQPPANNTFTLKSANLSSNKSATSGLFSQPLLTEFTASEQSEKWNVDETSPIVDKSGSMNAPKIEAPALAETIPQEILPKTEPANQEVPLKSTPQEIIAKPNVLIQAEEQVREVIRQMWGKSGVFGIGSSDGMDTFESFSNKTVEEVLKMSPNLWINKDAQYLIDEAHKQTNVAWTPNESFAEYLKRATATAIDRITKKG